MILALLAKGEEPPDPSDIGSAFMLIGLTHDDVGKLLQGQPLDLSREEVGLPHAVDRLLIVVDSDNETLSAKLSRATGAEPMRKLVRDRETGELREMVPRT